MIEYFPPIDNAKDYIRRGDLLFKSTFRDGIFDNSESTLQRLDHYYVSLRQVYEAPAADVVEVRHGQWVDEEYVWQGMKSARCNQCKRKTGYYIQPNYCPNCGAKMDGEENK